MAPIESLEMMSPSPSSSDVAMPGGWRVVVSGVASWQQGEWWRGGQWRWVGWWCGVVRGGVVAWWPVTVGGVVWCGGVVRGGVVVSDGG